MNCLPYARFPLSEHTFRTHFGGGDNFDENEISGYTPQMLRRAHSFNGAFTGEGIKIAVVSALDNVALERNMEVFCERFSLPVPQMSVHYPDGRAEGTSREWLVESSLDTQWAHTFAPQAELLAVFAKSAAVTDLLSAARYAAEELLADVVSMSFGTQESGADEGLGEFLGNKKCIFVASSGDIGGVVSFPSSSPDCISVGGTRLTLGSGGKRIFEGAWENSGGGASVIFEIPPWQGRFFDIYGMTDGKRGTPDVSMMANINPGAATFVSQLGGWTTVGGTSLAAACFSGICACVKQRNPAIKSSADILSFLYSRAGVNGYELPQYNFNDIILGKSGSFYAQIGWDFASGLGSPVINRLLS